MATWFTADLHFGHHNIIDYCERPFTDVGAMDDALVDNWNQAVGVDDEVWVIGDFALGKIADTLAITSRLNGHKILLAGNHDRCWVGHGRRAEGWTERYLEAGFAEVVNKPTTITVGEHTVLLCHFPYRGDSHDEDRYVHHRPADKGAWLVHGHVHNQWAQRGRMINVGVDANGFAPVSEAAITDAIRVGPTNR